MTITKELRFAMDEKGLKTLLPTLLGQRMSYWDNDRQLKHGTVKGAEMARDRYGNPFVEVEIEEEVTGSDHGTVVEAMSATVTPAPFPGGGEGPSGTEQSLGRPSGRPS